MKVYPTQNRIMVKQDERDAVSEGGILLANKDKDKPLRGLVVGIGPDVVGLKENMKVLFAAYAGTKVGKEHLIMEENDIIAVYGDDE